MRIYIYQIWFPTSKKSYIGQTKDIKKRMQDHFKSGSLVCRALWKYDDWQVTILHTTNKELANQLEIEDIRNHNSVVPNGYNFTHGGEGGDTFTNNPNKEKTRKKMQGNKNGKGAGIGNQNAKGKNLGNQFAKEANIGNQHAKGNKLSKETRLKMRVSQIKRRLRELS